MGFTYVLLLSTLGLAIHTQAQNCSPPEPGKNMELRDNVSQTFPDGVKVSFICDFGYSNVGGSTSITCNAGSWSPLRMTCEKNNCGPAEEVPFGSIDYSEGSEFGNKLVVTCNAGYTLVGKSEIFCGAQGWMGRLPVCEVVVCLKPVLNATATFSPIKETYEYRDVIRYTCPNDDTLSGSTTSSCSADGTFKPAPPTCVKVQCKDPIIDNGNLIEGSRPPHKYKATVIFDCKSGYSMEGARTQICEINSQWSPGLPTCQLTPTTRRPSTTKKTIVTPTTRRPSTTKKTIVDLGPTDPPGNNGNAKAIALGIGLPILAIVLTFCGCYFCGVPAFIKENNALGEALLTMSLRNQRTCHSR